MIVNITCYQDNYLLRGTKWVSTSSTSYNVDDIFISNMLECRLYSKTEFNIHYKKLRRLGKVVHKIYVMSQCRKRKNIYVFSYGGAKVV